MPENEPSHLQRGRQTRERVLSYAVEVATAEGLEALTLGRVAQHCELTKAGLIGHFGSKQALQIATLNTGAQRFVEAVLAPGTNEPRGLGGLWPLLSRWVDYAQSKHGGCFFASVSAEFDTKPGEVRDRIAALVQAFIDELTRRLRESQELGHLRRNSAPDQLAKRLYAYELMMNLRQQLLCDDHAADDTRAAMLALLSQEATASGKRALAAANPASGRKTRRTRR